MFSVRRNVIFDDPSDTETRGEVDFIGNPIDAPVSHEENLYDSDKANRLLSSFLVLLIFQYLCIFSCVPFDEITNRPSICIISVFVDGFMFLCCCVMFPFASATPDMRSLKCLFTSFMSQVVGLGVCIPAVVMVLNTAIMYSHEYDSTVRDTIEVNVTTYIQVITCLTLGFHAVGTALSAANVWMAYCGVSNIKNRTNKKAQKLAFEPTILRDMSGEEVDAHVDAQLKDVSEMV